MRSKTKENMFAKRLQVPRHLLHFCGMETLAFLSPSTSSSLLFLGSGRGREKIKVV
jgi:hypothetical protein